MSSESQTESSSSDTVYESRRLQRYNAGTFRLTRYTSNGPTLECWLYSSITKMRLAGVPKSLYAYTLYQHIHHRDLEYQIARELHGRDYPEFDEFTDLLLNSQLRDSSGLYQSKPTFLENILSASKEASEP